MTGRWRNFNQPLALPIFDCGQVSLVLDNVLFESVSLTPNPFPTSLQFTIENNNEGFLPGPRCFYDTNLPLDSELRPMLPFASEEAWNKFILPEFFFPNVVPPANRTDSPSRFDFTDLRNRTTEFTVGSGPGSSMFDRSKCPDSIEFSARARPVAELLPGVVAFGSEDVIVDGVSCDSGLVFRMSPFDTVENEGFPSACMYICQTVTSQ